MAEHGGYRRPTNPAPVSGPGAHSRRTDGQPSMDLPDAQYGENAAFQDIQGGAQLGSSQAVPQGSGASAPPSFTSMDAPTQMPGTPVTDGADYGSGQSSAALGGIPIAQMDAQHLAKYLPTLVDIAERDDTPPGTKKWVRNIIANL